MRTVETNFSRVPVMGFFWMHGMLMVKISRRRAMRGQSAYVNTYEPSSKTIVTVLA